jgi:hypothetical protein
MKKIYSLLTATAFTLFSFGSFAQDLGIEVISNPANNSTMYDGFTNTTLTFKIKNYGTTNFTATSQLQIRLTVNGTTIATYNPPAGFTLNAGASSNDFSTPSANLGTAMVSGANAVCLATVYAADTDNSNDSVCNNVNLVTGTNIDISGHDLVVNSPFPVNNRFLIGSSITDMSITFRNNSTVTIPAGSVLNYTIFIKNNSQDVVGTLANAWAPNTNTTRAVTNTAIIPALPIVVGPFKICAYSRISSDNNNANDTICKDYEMYSTVSTEDVYTLEKRTLHAFYANDKINIDINIDNTAKVDFKVIGLNGQVVAQNTTAITGGYEQRHTMDVSNLAPGVYILNVSSEGELIETTKVVVQ